MSFSFFRSYNRDDIVSQIIIINYKNFNLDSKFLGILLCGAQLTCEVRNIMQAETTFFFT